MKMKYQKHLSDKDIIMYVNSGGKMKDKALERIEQHLYTEGCSICREKADEIKRLNHAMHNQQEKSLSDDDLYLCPQIDKAADFINKELEREEREQYYKHLAGCDICRKATALLTSTIPAEVVTESCKDEKIFGWKRIKDGVIRLGCTIEFSRKDIPDSLFSPTVATAAGKFRGHPADEADSAKSVEINLPENNGTIKLIYHEQSARKDKLVVEPLGIIHGKLLIEVYDSSGILLKSVDGSRPVSCLVKKGGYTIRINSKFEVPINLG